MGCESVALALAGPFREQVLRGLLFRYVYLHNAVHPLDPLTAAEIKAAAEACKTHAADVSGSALRFNTITLKASAAVDP